MQVHRFFTVDLTKIKGRGQFKCPKCGVRISPDDKTDRVYTILDTIVKNDELDSITLHCKRCDSQINLTGFRMLGMNR